jgi:hypothetical protein
MGLFRGSQVDKIVQAERDLSKAVSKGRKDSAEVQRAAATVEAARRNGSVAENIQASHECATSDRTGRDVRRS